MTVEIIKLRLYNIIYGLLENDLYKNIKIQLQKRALETTADYVQKNMLNVNSCKTRFEVLDRAINSISIENGLILEFGVWKGESINYIAKKLPSKKVNGFDSFEGLPEMWRDGLDKNVFQISDKVLTKLKFLDNIVLIKGYFDETLPTFFENINLPISFMHIDSDLYSSAKTIFDIAGKLIQGGTVIVFDEFFNYPGWEIGEFKAFSEFINEKNLRYKFITYNQRHEQVALKIV